MSRRLWLLALLAGCGEDGRALPEPAPSGQQGTDQGVPTEDAQGAETLEDSGLPDAADPEDFPDAVIPPVADAGVPTAPPDGPPDEPPAPAELPPVPTYSHGACPVLTGGATRDTSVIEGFPSGDQTRAFRLMVPSDYDGSRPLPVIFAWHWLNASSGSFVNEAELETAIEELDFIAVLPDGLRNDNGDKAYLLSWPFAEVWGVESELRFFDDLLACVTEQYNVDRQRVYGIGVSAGGLWVTALAMTDRANHFAAVEVLSGGLGDMLGVWRMEYAPQPNKYPALVVWGGPTDWLALSFHDASQRLRDALLGDDHFVVECMHDAGHGVPPVDPSEEHTKFKFLWEFMFAHTHGLPPGQSPYLETGLPDYFPPWCRISAR